jgi:hypothetical protein
MGKLINQHDWKPSDRAVKAAEPREFVPIKPMSIPMRDNLARCAEYRAKGKSYRRGGE